MISAIALIAFSIGVLFDVFGRLHGWLARSSSIAADNVPAIFVILTGVFAVFSVRRLQQAEREVERREETERRYRALVEQTPAVSYTWDSADPPGTAPALYVSPQIHRLLGFTAKEWILDPTLWERRTHPEDRASALQAWADATAREEQLAAEYRIEAADGRWVWIRDEATPVSIGTRGRPIYQGVMVDITEQKQTEQRYRHLVERLPSTIYLDAADDVATALYVSPQYESLTGYSAQERLGDPGLWVRMLHPDDRERVLAESDRTNRTGEPFDVEYRIVTKDGRTTWVHDLAYLVDDVAGRGRPVRQGVLTDITERKLAQDALSRRDQILEAVGRAAERFLGAESWTDAIGEVLAHLGRSGGASRAAVYGQVPDDLGRPCIVAVAEWTAPGVPAVGDLIGDRRLAFEDVGLSRWAQVLARGETINALTLALPEVERGPLQRVGARAVVAVPIFADGEWWGHLVYDQTDEDRVWQPAEVDALRVVANTLGAAITREHAALRLRQTEERYRSLVETIPAATYIDTVDALSKAVYMSPQVEQIFGYTPQEWLEHPELWEQGVDPRDLPEVASKISGLNSEGIPYEAEYRFRRPDGRIVWVHDQAVLIRDEHGAPRFTQGVMFDITERREAEEHLRDTEERFRAIVEHVPAAVYLDAADTSMRTMYVSPQIEDITGIPPQEWKRSPSSWADALHPSDRDDMLGSYRAAVAAQEPWSGEYRMLTRDGRTIWVHDETTFIHDGEGHHAMLLGVLTDITERKLAEETLRGSERREREAAERLRALDEMKNTFLAAVSHELRSPLTSILGLSLTLERAAMDEADRDDLLERLAANARKLDRLLKDLLDIDRLNRGIVQPQYHVTDVGALARRAIESLDALADRSVLIEADPVVVSVDAAKVERIVENLLTNAARHTTVDRRIWLRVRAQDDGVLIAVEDDGPGVPEELREAVFEPFRQGPSASAHAPGTGIGLSLVGRFAQLHGGRAWVEERAGGGASFRVFLPQGPSVDVGAVEASGHRPTSAAHGRPVGSVEAG